MRGKNRQQVEVVLDADFLAGAYPVGALFRTVAHGRETVCEQAAVSTLEKLLLNQAFTGQL